MAIVQKSDGRWCVVQRLDGKQTWKYFGRGVEAEKAARDFDASLKDSGQVREYKKRVKSFGPTITELAEAYLQSKAATLPAVSIRNTTYKFTSVICNRQFNPIFTRGLKHVIVRPTYYQRRCTDDGWQYLEAGSGGEASILETTYSRLAG